MAEFFNVLPPDEARRLFLEHIRPLTDTEILSALAALGRITHDEIVAPHSLPTFRRSTMDGYAVRAADTHGAGESLPALLQVIGEVPMGQAADYILVMGGAVVVHTGGMLPDTADAVVQIEHTQTVDGLNPDEFPYEIEVSRAVASGQNVIQIGEDVAANAEILPAGSRLRPQDVGGLLALGIEQVVVARRPRVVLISTGDEVVPPNRQPGPGQIRDINSYTIAGQAFQAGAEAEIMGIVEDDLHALGAAAAQALAAADMLVISAGSSVSVRDRTVEVIDALGQPGVLLHGVATRPGKPTILGVVDGKPVLGLPGNPVSAMVQFSMFGVPAINRLQGASRAEIRERVWARLAQNVASASGREDYIPARLVDTQEGLLATPIFGKSNLIYTLVQANGLIKVPLNVGGLIAGELVEVLLL